MTRLVFVFGSNLAGKHGKGAAKHARLHWGAVYGVGEGIQGDSYGIPTKDDSLKTLPLEDIEMNVNKFISFAKENTDITFLITAIGTGLAGYKMSDIKPFFVNAPTNCLYWREFLYND